jgi:hypothetical protein
MRARGGAILRLDSSSRGDARDWVPTLPPAQIWREELCQLLGGCNVTTAAGQPQLGDDCSPGRFFCNAFGPPSLRMGRVFLPSEPDGVACVCSLVFQGFLFGPSSLYGMTPFLGGFVAVMGGGPAGLVCMPCMWDACESKPSYIKCLVLPTLAWQAGESTLSCLPSSLTDPA